MRRVIERLGLTEDLLVILTFGGLLLVGVLLGGTALYEARVPLPAAVPPVFAAPERFAGQSDIYVDGVLRQWVQYPDVLEMVPMAGGMLQPDPPLLVVIGPGATDAAVRGEAQELHFWGTIITSPEDVPPGAVLTPAAARLIEDGQLFYYAERE